MRLKPHRNGYRAEMSSILLVCNVFSIASGLAGPGSFGSHGWTYKSGTRKIHTVRDPFIMEKGWIDLVIK